MNNEDIGNFIRNHRVNKAKATHRQFSEITGFPSSTLCSIEKSRFDFRYSFINSLIEGLGYEFKIVKKKASTQ